MRVSAPGITQGENSVDAHGVPSESRCPVSIIYLCAPTASVTKTTAPLFDAPRSSWRLITTRQQGTSIGRAPNVAPSIRGTETRRQDNSQSPLSSFPVRQARETPSVASYNSITTLRRASRLAGPRKTTDSPAAAEPCFPLIVLLTPTLYLRGFC